MEIKGETGSSCGQDVSFSDFRIPNNVVRDMGILPMLAMLELRGTYFTQI